LRIRDCFEHICLIFTKTDALILLKENPSSTKYTGERNINASLLKLLKTWFKLIYDLCFRLQLSILTILHLTQELRQRNNRKIEKIKTKIKTETFSSL
jgi:hypothetical protein